jgi:hypothetical protein
LLGQYCSIDDPDLIEKGVETVKRILADNYVRPDEAQKILSVLRSRGSYTVIDKLTVSLNIKKNIYEAFANTATENGKKAEACLETINNNLESLKTKLPQEIINYIDDGIKNIVYQDFYKQLNKFGVDEKILVKSTVDSYEAIRDKHFQSIMDTPLTELTETMLQDALDKELDSGYTVNTVRKYRAVLMKLFVEYRPGFVPDLKVGKGKEKS